MRPATCLPVPRACKATPGNARFTKGSARLHAIQFLCSSPVPLSRNPEICAAELDGEVCLFNPQSAEYLNLNPTGSCIWTLLEAPAELEELICHLQVRYAVDPETCRHETEAFVAEALKRGMLVAAQPA